MNSKEVQKLILQKKDQDIGILERTESGAKFTYLESYLSLPNSLDLSFCYPKRKDPYIVQGDNLHPFFANLLPEGLRLKTVLKNLKTSTSDMFSVFAEVGGDCIGDIHVKKELKLNSKIPKWSEIQFYEYFFETLGESYTENASLAGVQEKISASMISLPLKGSSKRKSYILKLNPKDKPELVLNEYYCLLLAKKCGIAVNNSRLIQDKNKNSALLVERFDRFFDFERNKIEKIHQEDVCQLMNKYPADKYRVSFNEIALKISQIAHAPRIEIKKLLDQYIFNYLICNGDMHAKNISVYSDPRSGVTALTPAYDLISTIVYGDLNMALALDGRDKNFTRKSFIQFGERFLIPAKSTEQSIDKLLGKIKQNKKLLEKIPLQEKQQKLLFKNIEERLKSLV